MSTKNIIRNILILIIVLITSVFIFSHFYHKVNPVNNDLKVLIELDKQMREAQIR